ncbi:MAG: hypothetical protein AAFX65_09990 [Cyanobacteria bacterium J06638_7]
MTHRRQRLHELVLALIRHQPDLELLHGDHNGGAAGGVDAASWLERNRQLVQRYQALVRTAVTIDALVDQELANHL